MPRLLSSKVILFIFALVVSDMCLLPSLQNSSLKPVLSYLFVPYAALEWHWNKTLPAALLLGFVRDLLSIQLFGTEMLALVTASLALNFFIQKMSAHSWILKMVATFLFVFFAVLNTVLIHGIHGFPGAFSWFQWSLCWTTALASSIAMPIVFYLAHRWFREDFRYSNRAL